MDIFGRKNSNAKSPYIGWSRGYLPCLLIVVAVEFLPAISCRLYLDDWQQVGILTGDFQVPDEESPFVEFYTFSNGDPQQTLDRVDQGQLPWWTDEELKLRFCRPLSVISHYVDQWLWADSIALMHAHSVIWYLLVVTAAAFVYRDIEMTPLAVGLASLCFAIDDNHAVTVGWLANRNHLISGVLVLLAFRSHVRWQNEGRLSSGVTAAAMFIVALLTGEAAVAYGAFVFAWAVTLHPGSARQRVISVVPGFVIGILWLFLYRKFEFGTVASGLYVNPVGEPLEFLGAVAERIPLFLAAVFGTSSTELSAFANEIERQRLWWWSVGTVVPVCLALFPTLRRDRLLQFWGLAAMVSLLPLCAATPIDRVLLITTVASHGLLARFLELTWPALTRWRSPDEISNDEIPHGSRLVRFGGTVVLWVLVVQNLITPVWMLPLRIATLRVLGERQETAATSPALDQPLKGRQVVLVNPPDMFYGLTLPRIRSLNGLENPEHVRVLATGLVPLRLERTGDRTLVLKPGGPFLNRAFAELYRRDPLTVGWERELTGMHVRVLDLDEDDQPAAINFEFDETLESAELLWVEWRDGQFVELKLPAVGDSLLIPAAVDGGWFSIGAMREAVGFD
jgi:hypothetical protein